MAHVVGVPRRDPCQKCQLPVFLAERLLIGKQVYHRTCLKCARCGSQLSPGSFYETEVNGEFCCETCPDEEDQFAAASPAPAPGTAAVPLPAVRNSLSERLAFFEQQQQQTSGGGGGGHKVLQKSVSDEEKRQHLRENNSPVYKGNAALKSFLQSTVDEADTGKEEEGEDKHEEEKEEEVEVRKKEVESQSPLPMKRFTTTAQLSLHIEKEKEKPEEKEEVEEKQLEEFSKKSKAEEAEAKEPLNMEIDEEEIKEGESEKVTEVIPPLPSSCAPRQEIETETQETLTKTEEIETKVPLKEIETKTEDAEEQGVEAEDCTEQEIIVEKGKEEKQKETQEEQQKEEQVQQEEELSKPLKSEIESSPTQSSSHTQPDKEQKQKAEEGEQKEEEDDYPESLNPFASDEDDEDDEDTTTQSEQQRNSLNPFDSSDDEVELNKLNQAAGTPPEWLKSPTNSYGSGTKVPPPRPPPPSILKTKAENEKSTAGGELENGNFQRSASLNKKMPLPTPRSSLSHSQTPTPEPTPRLSQRNAALPGSGSPYNSNSSLSTPGQQQLLQRDGDGRGSMNSLSSSRSRKTRRAPVPPTQSTQSTAAPKELFPVQGKDKENNVRHSSNSSLNSEGNSLSSPKTGRKKRLAPAPPKPARLDPATATVNQAMDSKNLISYPLQGLDLDSSKLSDEEKALLEGKPAAVAGQNQSQSQSQPRRLIPLDLSLLSDGENEGNLNSPDEQKKLKQEAEVVYRRLLMPPSAENDDDEDADGDHYNRQLEKLKDNKEAQNRTRQSQLSCSEINASPASAAAFYDKSMHGKWKRRKGPAPALPIPPRKVLQMLPLQEIRHELEIIEVQQQGLEKQGVILEKMIRDRCEGAERPTEVDGSNSDAAATAPAPEEQPQNSKEVEDLILQLFELVNEKNELFRRQAELMYLRRQHRLEQEQADIEYEIRVLMGQPERNKTDSDKSREEALIARLVEVVELRNEVIDCLEMDRLREAEEDLSIKQRLEQHNAKRETSSLSSAQEKSKTKLSKKERKQQKELKKLNKAKKLDVDKDADESEQVTQEKTKKKLKFFF